MESTTTPDDARSIPMARHMEFIRATTGRRLPISPRLGAKAPGGRRGLRDLPGQHVHQAFPFLIPRSPIPFLHIADVVAEEAKIPGSAGSESSGPLLMESGGLSGRAVAEGKSSAKFPIRGTGKRINEIIFRAREWNLHGELASLSQTK